MWVACLQAWGVLEAQQGNIGLARQLFKCAVKADPASEKSWLVRHPLRSPSPISWSMSLAERSVETPE